MGPVVEKLLGQFLQRGLAKMLPLLGPVVALVLSRVAPILGLLAIGTWIIFMFESIPLAIRAPVVSMLTLVCGSAFLATMWYLNIESYTHREATRAAKKFLGKDMLDMAQGRVSVI